MWSNTNAHRYDHCGGWVFAAAFSTHPTRVVGKLRDIKMPREYLNKSLILTECPVSRMYEPWLGSRTSRQWRHLSVAPMRTATAATVCLCIPL